MSGWNLILGGQTHAWQNVLDRCGNHDVYHLPEFHEVFRSTNVKPFLYVWHEGASIAALPMLVQSVADVPGLAAFEENDAASVYGYAGPVTNLSITDPQAVGFRQRFQAGLRAALRDLNVVSLFVRSNPFIPAMWLMRGDADLVTPGQVVAMDLTLDQDALVKQFSKRVQRDLNKARSSNVCVREIPFGSGIDDFMSVYNATMRRKSARQCYFFSKDYYSKLSTLMDDRVKLFVATRHQQIDAAAIFLMHENNMHYHLGGTRRDALPFCGIKLILTQAGRWGRENGYRWLNLGGGVNSTNDSLMEFKLGFSKITFDYQLASLVVDHDRYADLCRARTEFETSERLQPTCDQFFPLYRRPAIARPAKKLLVE